MSDEPVICAQCRNLIRAEGGPRTDIWYNMFCGAVKKKKGIDFVSGKEGYVDMNDLGGTFVNDNPHPFARDVNPDGKCCLFEPMEQVKQCNR